MEVKPRWQWVMGASIALMIFVVPFIYYRMSYTYAKRLRTVTEGRVYRSGLMTADGLKAAIEKYQIKTVINFKDETPDPELALSYFDPRAVKESELCKSLGVNWRFVFVDTVYPLEFPKIRVPEALEKFYEIMDNPKSYPVLIHCQAGLHRTGVMAAVYRMEYEGWSPSEAIAELKNHGFGEFYSTSANPYIDQYVVRYQTRRERQSETGAVPAVLSSRTLTAPQP